MCDGETARLTAKKAEPTTQSLERSGEFAGDERKTMSTATEHRTAETAGQIAQVVIRPDALCGRCNSRRDSHFFEGDQVYCNNHTTGDVFTTEPSDTLVLHLIIRSHPGVFAEVVDKWKKKQGFIPSGPTARIGCPACGPVDVECDVFDGDKGISGECPECGARLLFG